MGWKAMISVMLLVILFVTPVYVVRADSGVYIVSVFPNIARDVSLIICSGDVVDYLIPPGVDPHEYQLTTGDYDKLSRASVIISTGHTGAEEKIEDMVSSGELKAVLINIMEIPGIRLAVNPSTGQPNLHMPIYDPLNYIMFVENLTNTLASINPSRADCYRENALRVINEVVALTAGNYRRYLGIPTVLDSPGLQYAVEWMGFRVLKTLIPEHDVQPSPQDISVVEGLLRSGTVPVVFVTAPAQSSESRLLQELAGKYNVTVVSIPSPVAYNSTLEKLESIALAVSNINLNYATGVKQTIEVGQSTVSTYTLVFLSLLAGIIAGFIVARWIRR